MDFWPTIGPSLDRFLVLWTSVYHAIGPYRSLCQQMKWKDGCLGWYIVSWLVYCVKAVTGAGCSAWMTVIQVRT